MLPIFEVKTGLLIDRWGGKVDQSGDLTADMDVQTDLTHLVKQSKYCFNFPKIKKKSLLFLYLMYPSACRKPGSFF